jgi:hypothetical protein
MTYVISLFQAMTDSIVVFFSKFFNLLRYHCYNG